MSHIVTSDSESHVWPVRRRHPRRHRKVEGELTVRGVRRPVVLDVRRTGEWSTPWWEDGVDKGPKLRAGFLATARIDRDDFGVSWNSPLEKGGVVVGGEVAITIDAEAIRG